MIQINVSNTAGARAGDQLQDARVIFTVISNNEGPNINTEFTLSPGDERTFEISGNNAVTVMESNDLLRTKEPA
jgi:hypothetical protein